MARQLIGTINDEIASGGTVTGDLTVEGDLTIQGSSTSSNYDEVIDGHVQITSTNKLKFGGSTSTDSDSYILESSADVLDVYVGGANMMKFTESTTDTVLITGNVDLNGTLDASGAVGLASSSGVTTIGSSNGLTVSAAGVLTVNSATDATNSTSGSTIIDGGVGIAKKLYVGTDLDVDGTTNLDAVDIDGAVQSDSTITVGANDQGYDVKFFGDTASAYMLWDTSEDDLVLAGAAGLDVAGDIDIDGTSNLDNTDIDGTLAVDGTTISLDATTSFNIDNSNTSNGITVGTATSAVPISIGHTTSVVTINDEVDITGTLDINDTTDSSSKTTGALKVDGGVGIALKLFVGTDLDVDGTTNLDTVDIDGDVDISGSITNAAWTGDVIASAYLDSDTAHLTTTQTFSGAKTFSADATHTGSIIIDADDKGLILGADQDATIYSGDSGEITFVMGSGTGVGTNEGYMSMAITDGGDTTFDIRGGEDGKAFLRLTADQGDNNADHYRIVSNTSNGFTVDSYSTGAWVSHLILDANSRISLSNNDASGAVGTTLFGYNAGANIVSGAIQNTYIGHAAGDATHTNAADNNTGVGYGALTELTTGLQNTAIGSGALDANTAGGYNTAVGVNALGNATTQSDQNVAIGRAAMSGAIGTEDVNFCVVVGDAAAADALTAAASGTVAVGKDALAGLTSGAGNTAIGYQSLDALTGSGQNTAIGYGTLGTLVDGDQNTAVGYNAMTSGTHTSYNFNTIVGANAGDAFTSVAIEHVTGVGANCIGGAVTAAANGATAVGSSALGALTSGPGNTAVGYQALRDQTTGNSNTAIGYNSMVVANHADADQNTCVGYVSGDAISSGQKNTLIGNEAGANRLTTGDKNTAVGAETLGKGGGSNLTGDSNTAIGFGAGLSMAGAPAHNVLVGHLAGDDLTTATKCTMIGAETEPSAVDADNQTAIGYGAQGLGNGTVTLGDAAVTAVYMSSDGGAVLSCGGIGVGLGVTAPSVGVQVASNDILISTSSNGVAFGTHSTATRISADSAGASSTTLYIGNASITVSSDVRIKENIIDTEVDAISKLNDLRVVDFTWNDPSDKSFNNKNARGTWTGLIAQEVIEHIPFVVNAVRDEETLEPVPDAKQVDMDGNETGEDALWQLEYDKLVPVLIKAVQVLSEKVKALEDAQ